METQTGRTLGRCHDLRGELTGTKLRITGICVGTRAWLSHLGIRSHGRHEVVPWADVIRIEADRIVVRREEPEAGGDDSASPPTRSRK